MEIIHLNKLYCDGRLAHSSSTHHDDLVSLVEMGPVRHPLGLVLVVGRREVCPLSRTVQSSHNLCCWLTKVAVFVKNMGRV